MTVEERTTDHNAGYSRRLGLLGWWRRRGSGFCGPEGKAKSGHSRFAYIHPRHGCACVCRGGASRRVRGSFRGRGGGGETDGCAGKGGEGAVFCVAPFLITAPTRLSSLIAFTQYLFDSLHDWHLKILLVAAIIRHLT